MLEDIARTLEKDFDEIVEKIRTGEIPISEKDEWPLSQKLGSLTEPDARYDLFLSEILKALNRLEQRFAEFRFCLHQLQEMQKKPQEQPNGQG